MINITQNLLSSNTITGRLLLPALASISAISTSAATASTPVTYYDSNLNENDAATVWNEYQIEPVLGTNPTIEVIYGPITLTDNRISPTGNGGIGAIRIQNGIIGSTLNLQSQKFGASTYREFVSFRTGTVAKHLTDQVLAIADATPDLAYFSVVNHATATYTRNASCWAASVDLSAVAVASSYGTGWIRQRGGTLITARHVLFARHYTPPVGTQLRFANSSGTVETKTLLAVQSAFGDCTVGLLDSAVTVATPMKVAGSWIIQDNLVVQSAAQERSYYCAGLAIYTDQFADVYVCELGSPVSKGIYFAPDEIFNGTTYEVCDAWTNVRHAPEVLTGYNSMFKTPIAGDSGQPVMAVVNGEPVLLFCWWTASSGPPTWRQNGALLNALIAAVDAAASVTTNLTITVAPSPI